MLSKTFIKPQQNAENELKKEIDNLSNNLPNNQKISSQDQDLLRAHGLALKDMLIYMNPRILASSIYVYYALEGKKLIEMKKEEKYPHEDALEKIIDYLTSVPVASKKALKNKTLAQAKEDRRIKYKTDLIRYMRVLKAEDARRQEEIGIVEPRPDYRVFQG